MSAVVLSPIGGSGQQFLDANGNPLAGGKLYSYSAGTTTPQATYTDVSGNTANTNPVILGSDGRASSGGVWLLLGYAYKFVLKTSADVLVASWDNITGVPNQTNIVTVLPMASQSTLGQMYLILASGNNPTSLWIGVTLVDGSYGFQQLF